MTIMRRQQLCQNHRSIVGRTRVKVGHDTRPAKDSMKSNHRNAMAKMAVFPSPTKPCVDTKGQQRRRPLQNKGGEMQSRASHRSLIFSLILESCRHSSLHSALSTQRSATAICQEAEAPRMPIRLYRRLMSSVARGNAGCPSLLTPLKSTH